MGLFSSRRMFLAGLSGVAASSFFSRSANGGALIPAGSGRFKLSVITDEISQDLAHALEIASKEFGLAYVELRTMWNKNVINLDEKETGEVRREGSRDRRTCRGKSRPIWKFPSRSSSIRRQNKRPLETRPVDRGGPR